MNAEKQGLIVKILGGFYFVTADGERYSCSLRGRLKKEKIEVLCGDKVRFNVVAPGQGVVEEILPRQNRLIRPKIANVEQGLIILASQSPDPDFALLDRLLVLMQAADIEPVICLNKCDLPLSAADEAEFAAYEAAGFKIIRISALEGIGDKDIEQVLDGRISVVAGPSGAGKSTTLNRQQGLELETGEISEKLGRGRHTTRCVELLPLNNGWVADTPGFSRLDLPKEMEIEDLKEYYPEFVELAAECRFDGCLHDEDADCAVRAAVEEGRISAKRYARYLDLLNELRKNKENEYR